MSLITKIRKQKAVYWEESRPDGTGGSVFSTPVEISCRISGDVVRVTTEEGVEVVASGIVYSDRVLKVGGFIWEGLLANIGTGTPMSLGGRQVVKFSNIPDFDCVERLYKGYLK